MRIIGVGLAALLAVGCGKSKSKSPPAGGGGGGNKIEQAAPLTLAPRTLVRDPLRIELELPTDWKESGDLVATPTPSGYDSLFRVVPGCDFNGAGCGEKALLMLMGTSPDIEPMGEPWKSTTVTDQDTPTGHETEVRSTRQDGGPDGVTIDITGYLWRVMEGDAGTRDASCWLVVGPREQSQLDRLKAACRSMKLALP